MDRLPPSLDSLSPSLRRKRAGYKSSLLAQGSADGLFFPAEQRLSFPSRRGEEKDGLDIFATLFKGFCRFLQGTCRG